jgi:hypothetical protein
MNCSFRSANKLAFASNGQDVTPFPRDAVFLCGKFFGYFGMREEPQRQSSIRRALLTLALGCQESAHCLPI